MCFICNALFLNPKHYNKTETQKEQNKLQKLIKNNLKYMRLS